MDYEWAPVLRLLAAGLVVSVAGLLLPPMRLLPSIGTHAALFVAYVLLLWILPILRRDEKDTGLRVARRFGATLAARAFGREGSSAAARPAS